MLFICIRTPYAVYMHVPCLYTYAVYTSMCTLYAVYLLTVFGVTCEPNLHSISFFGATRNFGQWSGSGVCSNFPIQKEVETRKTGKIEARSTKN